jgi:hypothetical protein
VTSWGYRGFSGYLKGAYATRGDAPEAVVVLKDNSTAPDAGPVAYRSIGTEAAADELPDRSLECASVPIGGNVQSLYTHVSMFFRNYEHPEGTAIQRCVQGSLPGQ